MTWAGGPWIVDTSGWARASNPQIAGRWKAAADAGELVGHPVVTLELLGGRLSGLDLLASPCRRQRPFGSQYAGQIDATESRYGAAPPAGG